ncbi:MAG: hypothetical protein ACLGG4_07515 [Gammaproteobacteria bacterium]|jgi:hypothetical protein
MEEDDYTPATRPDHWRLDVLEDQVDRLYYQGGAFFVAEVERCSKGRIWQPEEDLDISPDPEEQMARKDGLWLFNSADLMCESLVLLERQDFDVTEVLLVSPPALNRSDAWRCERLKALFGLCDEDGIEGGWLYIVESGAVYGDIDPICYVALGSARSMILRDPRTAPAPTRPYFPLPKIYSIGALCQWERMALPQSRADDGRADLGAR